MSFLAKGFQTQSGHSRKEHGGGVFSRVFWFLAALALCLSVLAVFPQDSVANVTSFTAARNGDTITLTWTYSKAAINNSYFYNVKGSNDEPSQSFSAGTAGENTLDIQISALPANAQVRFQIRGVAFTTPPSLFSSSWSDYISTLSQCSSQSGTDLQADCIVLETLYDSTGGANWADKTNWKTSNLLDTWHGITVDEGRVTEIRLYDNSLSGTISDLSDLTGLHRLDLGSNSLSGTIPALSALTELRVLLLDHNSLSGTIPDLSATKIRDLRLNDNNISGTIPTWLNNATINLRQLTLNNNRLSGSIPDLSNVDVDDLNLSNNRLSGTLPQARIPKAADMNLSGNSLSGSLPDLSSLTLAYRIDFSNNQFGGTLNAGHLPVNVAELYLNDNLLSGSIPDLTTLTKLATLNLQNNRFSGTIPDLSDTATREVWLNGNSISGTIDANDLNSGGLAFLYLHDNKLSGSVDLRSLTRLLEVSLWGNPNLNLSNILGVEQKEIEKAALVMLYYDTGGDGWKGTGGWFHKYNFGAWHGVTADGSGNVTGLDLRNNRLRGNIRTGLTGLASLATLDLSCNSSLRGEFPLGLKDNTNLTSVNICSTGMTLPTDTDFTTWKDGNTVTFTDGTCSPACPQPVQQSSPPVTQRSQPQVEEGEGEGEGEQESIQSPDSDPVPADPASDPGGIEAQGGCALVSGTGKEHPGTAVLGLFLAASVLLAVSRVGRRAHYGNRNPKIM